MKNKKKKSYARYYLPSVEIKNYNVMNDGQNVSDQPVRNNLCIYMLVSEKLQQVKGMITQLVVCCTKIISKTIIG